MVELVECVPNFSEGRRPEVIEAIVAAARAVPGVRVLGTHSDPEHNRSVLTYVAPPEAALEAGFAVAREAVRRIDLREHSGAHPRMGALDVFPFIPLGEVPMARCVELARALGARIARRVRGSSGGLRYVKALGLEMAGTGETQVSMNLTNFRASSIVTVMDLIRAEAARHGVPVTHSEVVGLIPLDALLDAAVAFLQLKDFTPEQVLERRLW